MVAACQATFKLGIQFTNWGRQGDSYLHPFGNYGYAIDGVAFHHVWHRLKAGGDRCPIQVFNLETLAAHFGKIREAGRVSARAGPPADELWQVPRQHRNGNGHVYCSYMSDDEAHDILVNNLAGKPTADPNFLRFTTGRRKKFWNRNVVAVGLSGGFMEPLESTSIHLVNTAITKLIAILSFDGISDAQPDGFNRLTGKEFERIRDFLILHYNATERDDSEFWNCCRTMDVPDTLTEKVELFRSNGQIFREDDELFTETSRAAVMMGQGVMPGSRNAMAYSVGPDVMGGEVDGTEQSIRWLVERLPAHGDHLARYCPATA